MIFSPVFLFCFPSDDTFDGRPEDEKTEEMRRTLTAVATDDEDGEPLPFFIQLIPLALIVTLGAVWYRKRVELDRTGRHKKNDG